ncbi:MAG TPA: hypothetical protein VHL10_00820 [Nitrososphaera sp.]|jgi:hypothetical protein|nr:hypothetical protein [Nitrososphaera sp.]
MVQARFFLQEVRRIPYYTSGGNTEATNIKLVPVQGEPFGPATPQGTIEMLIVNPVAAQVFLDAPLLQQFDIVISPAQTGE